MLRLLSALLSKHYVVRTLGFIHRNSSDLDQANCLLTLYTSLVLLIFEYESVIICHLHLEGNPMD